MSSTNRWLEWLYPQLRAFETLEERQRALKRCNKRMGRDWLGLVLLIVGQWALLGALIACRPLVWHLRAAGLPLPILIPTAVVGFLLLVLVYFLPWFWWSVSRERRGLRRLFEDEWLLICQSCGYNLTGNVSGVCPECGEKV